MPNSLFRQASLKIGPIVLETLVKHYFDRILKDGVSHGTKLRSEELIYDEAFTIVKTFLEAASKHTVEELQGFSNTRTPSPPWVHVVRLLVPMSCCDDAATYLVQALGGEEMTKKMVGGTKWWQVRGIKGIAAEWITAKKDWQKHKAHAKERSGDVNARQPDEPHPTTPEENERAAPAYEPEMDAMRCILYAHGGGYYFGSVDQERYSIQRHARKINGRVFAINYRLAPQYPFPCAIQDLLASYLYLIRPPEGSLHCPVKPEHIVVMGDSAGGGLCITFLQIVRDVGLPMPASGVLISPWCDLTHSFPSVHTNTATDVMPPYGLSFHKPSTLWPPPPEDLTIKVHEGIRSRIRDVFHGKDRDTSSSDAPPVPTAAEHSRQTDTVVPGATQDGKALHLGSSASLPLPDAAIRDQTVSLVTADGERLTVNQQIHLYTTNDLLTHPLVSPVLSYMGGLPPLLIIASEKEVLRDEIIYLAHKAAHPDKYPLKDEVRQVYPPLQGIETRYGPTKVHLQVYDDTAHVLPVLFSFTTPAKFCFRAIATFIKYTTGMLPQSASAFNSVVMTVSPASTPSLHSAIFGEGDARQSTSHFNTPSRGTSPAGSISHESSQPPSPSPNRKSRSGFLHDHDQSDRSHHRGSTRRAISVGAAHASSFFKRTSRMMSPSRGSPERDPSGSADVAGPRFPDSPLPVPDDEKNKKIRTAGEFSVYDNGLDDMIRERVSTRGVIRPLEPEEELSAFRLPPELIGAISELALRRYNEGLAKYSKKFAKTTKKIAKERSRNIDKAKKDTLKNMSQLQTFMEREEHGPTGSGPLKSLKNGLNIAGSWSWVWALDADERPPPSSIVSRRDTEEARRLAKIADQAVLMDEHVISGNNLWTLIIDFLTVNPDKHRHFDKSQEGDMDAIEQKHRSRFAQFSFQRRKEAGGKSEKS